MSATDYINKLNEEQKAAALATEGPVLVIAGAGSGKTRVLTSRIAHLVEDLGVKPRNILAITFTNKAANEMKERLSKMIGEEAAQNMWVSTIHSMCVRILRATVDRIPGYNKNFTIYSEVDKERVLKRIITDLKLEGDSILKNAKTYISEAKNKDVGPSRMETEIGMKDAKLYVRIYEAYEQLLLASNAMDFDDLIVKTLHLLEDDEEVRSYYAEKFKYIHIDEFQDTNFIQYRIAKLLSSAHGNIFVVGDDDQSIYGWRGAEIKNILGFDKDFAGAKVFKLQQNYRSTKKILDLANTIIANNTVRSKKVLWTENDDGAKIEFFQADSEGEEAEYACAQIKNLVARGASYKDFAVLMRINALSRSYEQEFLKYNVPYKVFGGFKFFERKEIKDLTAYLRILTNPLDDEAVLRIINTPKRGIGEKTITELTSYASSQGFSVFDALCEVDFLPIAAGARSRLTEFRKLLSSLALMKESTSPDKLVEEVIRQTNFMTQFETETEENISKRMNVDEFRNSIQEFLKLNKDATLDDYLGSIALSSDLDEADSSDYVTLATIHSVKGLEFSNVFIVGLDETIFPISRAVGSPAEMEEERRLMYVAITRAMKRLYLTRAKSRYLYGERQLTAQSRFLGELAPKLGIKPPAPKQPYREKSRYDDGYYADDVVSSSYSSTDSGTSNYARSFVRKPVYAKQQAASSQKDFSRFKPGKHVKHAKFGIGTIIDVKESSGKLIADVGFKGLGVKSFSVALAPMDVID